MSDDPNIDLKKRARRRLVGAAALALLAVIVLPLVMDSEPKPSGQEIQIRIPSQDSDSLVTRVIPGHSTSTPILPEANLKANEAPISKPMESAAEKPARSSTADAPIVAPKPKAEAVAKAETAKKVEEVHAEAVLEGKDSDQWIVQLGAYQDTANVKQLTTKIKAIGLPTYLEKLDSPQGLRTRVRAGPFKSRDEADKARLRIKKLGVDGSVAKK
jgi:DedD protein